LYTTVELDAADEALLDVALPSSERTDALRWYSAGVVVEYPAWAWGVCPEILFLMRYSDEGSPNSCAAGRLPRLASNDGGIGATRGFCGKSKEDRREDVGDCVGGGGAPELVDAECKIDGRLPEPGKVVMVLQVEERRVAGGSGGNVAEVSIGLRETIDPRRCVIPNASESRRGELGPAVEVLDE